MQYKNIIKTSIILTSLLVLSNIHLLSQVTTVTGFVKDSATMDVLPLSNIYFKGTTIGVYSEFDGSFKLETSEKVDTIVIKQIGYKDFEHSIKPGQMNELVALMEARDLLISEIVILPGENPAHPIIRNIIKNKKRNNPTNFPNYTCQTYSRLSAGISNIKNKSERKNVLNMIGKNLPGIEDSLGGRYIPLFVTEKLATINHKKEKNENTINTLSEKTNGISVSKDLEIEGYTDAMSVATNFYSNKIVMLNKSFISPIAVSGFMHYKYYLEDSIKVGDKWEYRIRFKPKRKKDFAFIGELKVIEGSWAITKIDAKMPKNTNVNFLSNFKIGYEFQSINDSIYFFKKNTVTADFEYIKSENKHKPLIKLSKTTIYDKIEITKAEANTDSTNIDSTYISDADIPRKKLDLVLEKYRRESLTEKNSEIDKVIDSINDIWWVKQVDKITSMFLTSYYNVGKIDIGPYLDMLKSNKVEDNRIILTGRTAESFSEHFFVAAKIGYGTRDKQFKYGADVHYKFNFRKRRVIGLGYEHNMIALGHNQRIKLIKENMLATGQDNWMAHLISRKENDKIAMRNTAFIYTEHEVMKGFSTRLRARYERFFAGEFVPFIHKNTTVNYFDNYAATLRLRFSFKEKTVDKFFRRYYLGSKFPRINILATVGWYTLNKENNEYFKLHLTMRHKFAIDIMMFQYVVEMGQIFGDVPFPLLENHRANESYGYARFKFNMLDKLTLASDRYASIMAELHLNGLIFNLIPLIRKTNIREVLSAKVLYGSLRSGHSNALILPATLSSTQDKPYIELGAGIENIFKFFRLEAVWRVLPVEMKNSIDFGLRLGVSVTF